MRDVAVSTASPVEQKDGRWKVSRRLEAWKESGPRIFDDYLDRFKAIAVRVFREPNPELELKPDEWFVARARGKTSKYSSTLRKGLAETLALLGSHPEFLTSASFGKAQATAILTVREVLRDADWTIWASVNDRLPMFAEAAPEELLDAVERALMKEPPIFPRIFAQESAGVMGRNYLTGLLWALETLAWSPEYITRVVVIMGLLAAIDPGGNWANRPFNSLVDVLLPWHPQTVADITKRVAAVRVLLKEKPEIGWKLLLGLLPRTHSSTSGTRKPTWQKWLPEDWKDSVSDKDYWDQVIAYSAMAVEIAISDRPKLVELLDRIPAIPDPPRTVLLSYLQSEEIARVTEAERQPIWEALAKLISVHRQYSDAEWAMDAATVDKLDAVANRLVPQAPNIRYRRLFSGLEFELFDDKQDIDAEERKLESKRQAAVQEIVKQQGVEGLIDFARAVDSPIKVGQALGIASDRSLDAALLPRILTGERLEDFAAGFVWSRAHSFGSGWIDGLRADEWTEDERVQFLIKLPFRKESWQQTERLLTHDAKRYWELVPANPYQTAEEDLKTAAELLLEYQRPNAAVQALQRAVYRKQEIAPSLVAQALLASVSSDERQLRLDQHAARSLIKWLQDNPSTPESDLFAVEWSYLPLLDRMLGAGPKTLEGRLARDPAFFCQVIGTVFRSKNEAVEKKDASEEQKRIAENAFRLLHEWATPPGTMPEGTWDGEAFGKWLAAVKAATKESGHFSVAMSRVGQVLPYSPPDSDGLWINRAVAEALNDIDAEEMRSGFTCELFNMRGGHGYTAGREERELAVRYRDKAEAVENAGFYRLATALRDLANSYDRDAEREAARDPFHD